MFNIEKALIPVFITATVLTVTIIFFLIAGLVSLKYKKTKKEHDALKTINKERERTMYAISVEIHNNVNQILGLALITLNMIDKYSIPRQKKYIEDTAKMLNEAIRDLRTISHSLNSDQLKKRGLHESLEEECNRLKNAGKLRCSLDVEGIPMSFNDEEELILIRIAQEAIQNVLKHARARNLDIALNYEKAIFRMTIRDDGVGFPADNQRAWDGMGLQSIKNQSRIIEGCTADIHTQQGTGTAVTITVQGPRYMGFTD